MPPESNNKNAKSALTAPAVPPLSSPLPFGTTERHEPENGDSIMTVNEVADLLRVNRKTIYEAVRLDEIPHVRLGRSIRFGRIALLRWLAGRAASRAQGAT